MGDTEVREEPEQDARELEALENEVAATTIPLPFRALVFDLPAEIPALDLSEAIGALEDGKAGGIAKFFRETLGDAQYAALKSMKPTMEELGELTDAIAKAYGFVGSGE